MGSKNKTEIMENEENKKLEFTNDWESNSVEEEKSFKEFAEELAFHEASHFVFACIVEGLNLGFSPSNFI